MMERSKFILIMNAHPCPRPATVEPFAPEPLYELKIDADGDAVGDIAYGVRFSSSEIPGVSTWC